MIQDRTRGLALAAVLVLAGLAGVVAGARWLAPPPVLTSGTWLEPARALPDVSLLDQAGQPFRTADLAGRWTFLFFGFTHCPEACPTTLALLGSVRRQLAARGLPADQLPEVLLVSVDPERDTPAVLGQYLAAFGPGFRGATGSPESVRAFATALGVPYRKVAMAGSDDYMMDHSTAILLVAPDGRLAALFAAPQTGDGLATDFAAIAGRDG